MVPLRFSNHARPSSLKVARDQYSRLEQLPKLLRLWPHEADDYSYPGTLKVTALIRSALRAERLRARTNLCAYDLNRHLGLIEALKHERAHLKILERSLPSRMRIAGDYDRPRPAGTLRLGPKAGDVVLAVSSGS